MKISILICSRKRSRILERCLKKILSQNYTDFEILILCDELDEEINDYINIIESFNDPRISLIRSTKPLGVSGSRNMLMKCASNEIFVVIDDDAFFDTQDALFNISKIFQTHNDIGIIACKIKNHGNYKREYIVPFSVRFLKKYPQYLETSCYVSYFIGAAHAIRKSVIDTCGLYAQDLFYGEEELDLSYRAISHGWKIYYDPKISVTHIPQASVTGKNGTCEEIYHHVKNRCYLAYRYLPAQYVPIYLAIWLTRYFIDAIINKCINTYIKGLIRGMIWLRKTPREPLNSDAIKYIRDHFGRLWY